jgi:hypothetical protein
LGYGLVRHVVTSEFSVPVSAIFSSQSFGEAKVIFHPLQMAQVKFDRLWVHSYERLDDKGDKMDRVTSVLLYNRPIARGGRLTRKITNVRVYKVVEVEEWTWKRNLAKSEVQSQPHGLDSLLVFECSQWRKAVPIGNTGCGSLDDVNGKHFHFGPQDPKMVEVYDLLTKNSKISKRP